jgi:hypothetical protein
LPFAPQARLLRSSLPAPRRRKLPAASSATASNTSYIYIQFDNVHLRRDNQNVPSDLEQMPNLLNFLQNQGTLFTNHHTPLISHT